jgi:integrase
MLTDTAVQKLKPNGKPAGIKRSDGGGMYVHVLDSGKYWRMAYRFAGTQKTLSFGVYPEVSLLEARRMREEARELLRKDLDPMHVKRTKALIRSAALGNTFESVALDWHSWKSKFTGESTNTKRLAHLKTHVFPKLGSMPISDIKEVHLLHMLRGVEAKTAYTATRLREMCGEIFRFAIQSGFASYDPIPALKGAIRKPAVKHRPALTTDKEFGQFLRDLRDTTKGERLTKLCARLGLLTWTRPGELRQARWAQFDLEGEMWNVPAMVMKSGKNQPPFKVPLSKAALSVIFELKVLSGHCDRLFPSNGNSGGYISENTVNGLFKRIGYGGRQSHHGLRASARSLLSDAGFSRDALERQLDHKETDQSVAPYARGQFMDERREFMETWGVMILTLEAGKSIRFAAPTRRIEFEIIEDDKVSIHV